MIQTCINISIYSVREFLVAEIRATVWHIGRQIALATTDNHMNALDANDHQYPWHYGFQCVIELMNSMLRRSPTTILSLSRTVMCWLHFFCIAARILITNPILSCKIIIQRIYSFGKQLLRESVHLLREFLKHFWIISVQDTMHTLNGFTTFAYYTMTSFNTDSFFWVCDNLAIEHICNNKTLFIGDLSSSIYMVRAATGTLEPTLIGTVQLRITDKNGTKHTFTLTKMNYMPTSPVNLLLTCVLSKQFTDENGIDTH